MKNKLKNSLAFVAMASLFYVGVPATARSQDAPNQNVTRAAQDNDTTRREVAQFDQFLDGHPEIAEQVRKDPSLLDKRDFVDTHPELRTYLQDHPGIRDEIRENPNAFMHQENNFDRREDDRDINRARLDRFLDGHPEIAEQVRKDPSLLNNRDFVDHHPALQSFMQGQPGLRDEARNNPGGLISRQDDVDRRDDFDRRDNVDRGPGDRDVNHARLSEFLGTHQEIAEQLRKDPSLLNNRDFVDHHPALQAFMQNEPGVRDDIRNNPNGYLKPEDFDRHVATPNRDFDHGQLSSFRGFLDGHVAISQELSKNPSKVNDHDYMQNHPELQAYLKANPGVKDRLMADPQNFVKSSQQFSNHSNGWDNKTPTGETKPPTGSTKPPTGDTKPPTADPKTKQ
jgi:hypothetical protein